ncbi:MAG: DUF6599 family protein [Candidatus Eisenbacteria bacterium]
MHTALIVFVAALAACLPARSGDPAAGWTREDRALRFVGKDLYGHIDGGAELFYELGFRDLRVERYRNDGTELVLENYRMESPEAALAIYLATRGEENPVGAIGERNSGNRFQLIAVKGDTYLQVNNHTGEATLLPVMAALAEGALADVETGDAAKLLDLLPREGLVPGSERIVRGPYSLQAIFTFGDGDILRLGGKTFGVAGNVVAGGDSSRTMIRIPYPDVEKARGAFANLVENLDPYLETIRADPDRLLFRDYREKYGEAFLRDSLLEIRVNLAEPPK